MHEVSNPWPNFPDQPAYVLDIDQPSVDDWNQYVRRQQRFSTDGYFIHTELLPEPFVGNLTTAAVFLLMLNPGYSPDDHDVHEQCDFQQMVRSVHCQDVDCIHVKRLSKYRETWAMLPCGIRSCYTLVARTAEWHLVSSVIPASLSLIHI